MAGVGWRSVYAAPGPDGFVVDPLVERRAVVGVLQTPWSRARCRGPGTGPGPLKVRIAEASCPAASGGGAERGQCRGDRIGRGWRLGGDPSSPGPRWWGEGCGTSACACGVQQGRWSHAPGLVRRAACSRLLDGAAGADRAAGLGRGAWRGINRVGPSRRSVDDPSYVRKCAGLPGVLDSRPYAPVHLRAVALGGDLALGWVRRTRIDGDSWEGSSAARRATEGYLLRIRMRAAWLREEVLSAPSLTYTAAMRGADAPGAPFTIEVAQLSDRFGPGHLQGSRSMTKTPRDVLSALGARTGAETRDQGTRRCCASTG